MMYKLLLTALIGMSWVGVADAQSYDSRYRNESYNYQDSRYDDRRNDYRNRDRYRNDRSSNYSYRTMNTRDYDYAIATVRNTSFDDSKLAVANNIVHSNILSTDQIIGFIRLFSFEDTRMQFAKSAYDRCADPQNYFKVLNAFTFSSSKDELNRYIGRR